MDQNYSLNKILVSPSSFGKCGSEPIDLLKKKGFEVILNPYGRKLTSDEVRILGKDCVGIIAGVETLNSDVLKTLPKLKCISRCGTGIDNIDIKIANELGIIIKNTPWGPTQAVSELTIGLIFDLLRQISLRDRLIRKGQWYKKMGFLLKNKKVGIIGLGRIGTTTAGLLLKLGADVYGYDINADKNLASELKIKLLTFEQLLLNSDIICLHVSTKSENKYLIGEKEFIKMKKDSFLINVSRGGVVDEKALYTALKKGEISGAAVDVFETEPYYGLLTQLDNVILTPHIGSYAMEARLEMELDSVKNLLDVFKRK